MLYESGCTLGPVLRDNVLVGLARLGGEHPPALALPMLVHSQTQGGVRVSVVYWTVNHLEPNNNHHLECVDIHWSRAHVQHLDLVRMCTILKAPHVLFIKYRS